MSCTSRNLSALALAAVFLMVAAPSSAGSRAPDGDAPAAPVAVRPLLLPLAGPITDPGAEISSLVWKGDTLIAMPQNPEKFGGDGKLGFFTFTKSRLLTELAAPTPRTIEPEVMHLDAPGLVRICRGFDGLEALGIRGDRYYMTIEAKDDTVMAGCLISGDYDAGAEIVRIDMARLTTIPLGLNIPNVAEESLIVDGDRIITFGEANGRRVNPTPRAKVFDPETRFLGSIPFPHIEYRVTDATALDKNRRFWVVNYFYPPEAHKLKPDTDREAEAFGVPAGQQPDGCIERLLELEMVGHERIVRTATPPIWLATEPDGSCRNWEAIVRLDDRGFLLMTDKYPGTLLAFVPYHHEENRQ